MLWSHLVGLETHRAIFALQWIKSQHEATRCAHICHLTCNLLDLQTNTSLSIHTQWHTVTHTNIHTRAPLLTHKHPARELSQTNTRWLFCSWAGRPVGAAGGQRRREWGREGVQAWPTGGPLGQKDYQSAPCSTSPFRPSEVTFTGAEAGN